jgi:engulfment/cell motility protein 1
MPGDLRLVASPTTEALAVIQSLKAASHRTSLNESTPALLKVTAETIPLKLALFNLSKYIHEEDFAIEFMLRGGMRTLMKLLERNESGLPGNSLAVRYLASSR